MNDPLQNLISDDFKTEDREDLALLLTPYVSFDKNSKKMSFKESFQKIDNNAEKLEMVFLAEKAQSLLFDGGENEGFSQIDIISLDIMPPGSVKSTLKKMFDKKAVRKSSTGKYMIPNYRLPELFDKYLKK